MLLITAEISIKEKAVYWKRG